MSKSHVTKAWAVLLTGEDGRQKFLGPLGTIMTTPTRKQCEAHLEEWRRIAVKKTRARIVRIKVEVVSK